MSPPIQPALLILFSSLFLWIILTRFVVRSPLAKIPGPPKESWWRGNYSQLFDTSGWQFHHDIVNKYGSVVKIYGLFGDEQLYISDPLAIYHILSKDQDIYAKSDGVIVQGLLAFGPGLLSTRGERHKKQRKMMNPVFSMKHMRGLYPVMTPIALQIRDVLTSQVMSGNQDINVLKWISRGALEYIGQGGLGYSFDALDDATTDDYFESIRKFNSAAFNLVIFRNFMLPIINHVSPELRRKLVEWAPFRSVQRVKEIVDTMHNASVTIFNDKKEALAKGDEEVVQQVGQGRDIMSILLRANTAPNAGDRLPDNELLAQINTFIQGAHDTVASALCRILHQLALHPEVQSRLRDEIVQARMENSDLDYDALMGLPYLDAVTRETLRMFPPLPFSLRVTNKAVVLPLKWPIKSTDGKSEITQIPLKNRTTVVIATMAVNRSKAIWGEDADVWNPERWLAPLPPSVAEAHLPGIYGSMLTFLGGVRSCIGFKFAEMETKLTLSTLLETFKFEPSSKEVQWDMRFIQTPTLKGSGDTSPQLPMKISLVE
ncbi:cytochrome P450 [Rickenella mellea]|uniref:Cytochrome P450 n=1 Tax=Rickenella mellea TaxID=50990 RepID=A0A4Y7PXC0_9AGAM|nr:cytochrome P450 [Rickenella mellea]